MNKLELQFKNPKSTMIPWIKSLTKRLKYIFLELLLGVQKTQYPGLGLGFDAQEIRCKLTMLTLGFCAGDKG